MLLSPYKLINNLYMPMLLLYKTQVIDCITCITTKRHVFSAQLIYFSSIQFFKEPVLALSPV